MWQLQVEINKSFNNNFKIEDIFQYNGSKYKIAGIGHTHIICSNESHFSEDLFISKKDFLKEYCGVDYENKIRICIK